MYAVQVTPEQLNSMPADQRNAILQIRQNLALQGIKFAS